MNSFHPPPGGAPGACDDATPLPLSGRRASECLALLRARPPVLLDDEFGRDLLRVLEQAPVEDGLPQDS